MLGLCVYCFMLHYNKLVRDKMLEIAKKQGKHISVRNAEADEEYWFLLKNKLQEEVTELGEKDTMDSVADLLDVIDAIIAFKKIDPKMLKVFRENKKAEQGSFVDRVVLEQSDEQIGHDLNQLI